MGNLITDGIGQAVKSVGEGVASVAEVFTENAEKKGQRESDELNAVLKQYQSEFNNRQNRNWADSIADSFNRLVRPSIVTIIISVFFIAYISPMHFMEIAQALEHIPQGYWMLLSVIVTFYFGGRMQLKSHDFKMKKDQVLAVQALVERKKAFRKIDGEPDEPDRASGDTVAKSPQVDNTRLSNENKVVKVLKQTREQGKSDDKSILDKVIRAIKSETVNDEEQQNAWTDKRDKDDPFWFENYDN